jgi:peptide/nickel transport system permease protein
VIIVFGILFGIISALHKDTWIDRLIALVSTLGMSIPSFLVLFYLFAFGFVLQKYTHLNMTGSLYEVDDFMKKLHSMENIILPVVLGIRPLAVVIQLMRNSLLETFGQDYIRTARAKGLSEFQIIRKHALKLLKPSRYCDFRMVCFHACRCCFVEYIWLEWIRKRIWKR